MIITKSEIIENIQIAKGIWRMTFKSAEMSDKYIGAGQFVSVLANENWEHPIRRPMSIADVKDDEISIIYKIFGTVTDSLSKLRIGESIDVLGPLGNTFNVEYNHYYPILLGGGIGLSPIINLSNCLRQKGVEAITIIGAKSKEEHFLPHNPKVNNYLSTDDGSTGITGTVIDALKIVLTTVKNPKIFACGPKMMLSVLQKYINKFNIPGQFSVESYMACSVGFCQGCVIPNNKDDSYYLVCKDGPIFEADEVKFD